MPTNEIVEKSESVFSKRRLGWAGVAAFIGCAACCALPMLAVLGLGSGAAATITRLVKPGSELIIGGLVCAVALGIMAVRARGKQRGCGPSCDADGGCCDRGASVRRT